MYMPSGAPRSLRAVVPVAGLPGDVEAVHLVAAGHDRQRGGIGADVLPGGAAGTFDAQVVVLGRLVVELGDDAGGVGAGE